MGQSKGTLISRPGPTNRVMENTSCTLAKMGKWKNVKILKSSGNNVSMVALDTLRKWQLQRGPMVIEFHWLSN